jgi:predicted enzyme related to lactoylglutathione lyase
MANSICFFEIPGSDPERLRAFYERIFDWRFDVMPETGYLHITTANGLTGGIPGREEIHETLSGLGRMNYISVDDVDEHCELITQAGGKVVLEKLAVEGQGWYAVALDPEGNPFGIWKKDENATNGKGKT